MKWIFRILGVLVLVLAIALLIVASQINTIVTETVETLGPEYTQSEVSLAAVDLSVMSGNFSLAGLKVGNPAGFSPRHAFSLGEIAVDVDLKSVISDTIVVNSIEVVAPEVVFEQTLETSNLQTLQGNIEKAIGPGDTAEAGTANGKKLIIRDFRMTGGLISVSSQLLADKTLEVTLPDIHLTGIGEKSNGATVAAVTELLLDELTRQAKKAVASSAALGELRQQASERLERERQKLDDKKGRARDKARDKLKDLFK